MDEQSIHPPEDQMAAAPDELAIHPFPGLRPFEADEQDLFFGREGQSEEILSRLRDRRFVAVVGASGSGKSSLVRAGLLPYLYGGFLADGSSRWRVAIFRPGGDPIKNLAVALNSPGVLRPKSDSSDTAGESEVLLEVSLRRSGLGLIDAVRLARLPENEQVLIVVDQFEELFRFAAAGGRATRDDDAAAFIKLLLEAGQQRDLPIYVVLTMRSDYIGDCARYRGLPEAVTTGLYLIPRMTRDQRRSAIVEPVRVGGGTIAPQLVVRLLNDVGDDPDQLPILQHALMRTWDYWKEHGGDRRPIDVDDYVAIGGMADALSRHADEAYDRLPDDRFRAIAKRMFQALSEKGPDNREARRPTTVEKLAQVVDVPAADIMRVVDDFSAQGRSFLILNRDSVVDISHESLIRGWRRMRQWVEEEAESARVYRRLADTASLHAQGIAGLLRDPDLEHVLTWRGKEHPNLNWGQRYHPDFTQAMAFLEQSRIARDTEQRQRQGARRRMQLITSTVTAVIAVVAVVAVWQWHEASIETMRAQHAVTAADTERDHAQKSFTMTTRIANALVFDLGQDPRMRAIPHEMLTEIFDSAIQGYNELIKIAPTPEAYNGRGSGYAAKGELDNAIADYSMAISLDKLFAGAFYNRGLAYRRKHDYPHAIADYGQAIKIYARDARFYLGRGVAYFEEGDFDLAIADETTAIKIDPKFARAFVERAAAYQKEGKADLATADIAQAGQINPRYAAVNTDPSAGDTGDKDYDIAIEKNRSKD
jgi:tetratricopeptide (TPR) repeat protein